MSDAPRVGLFIDWENIKYSLKDQGLKINPLVLRRVATEQGALMVARAYADWLDVEHVRGRDPFHLSEVGIEPVYVGARGAASGGADHRRKNAVDVRMLVECMDYSYRKPKLDVFVLASGDHSVLSVVPSLLQRGKKVIVIGVRGHTAESIGDLVENLLFYQDIMPSIPQPASETPPPPRYSLTEVTELIVELAREERQRGTYLAAEGLLGILGRRLPGFGPTKYGYATVTKLLEDLTLQNALTFTMVGGRRVILPPGETIDPADETASVVTERPESVASAGELTVVSEAVAALIREAQEQGKVPTIKTLGGQFPVRYRELHYKNFGFARFGDMVRAAASDRYTLQPNGPDTLLLLAGQSLTPDLLASPEPPPTERPERPERSERERPERGGGLRDVSEIEMLMAEVLGKQNQPMTLLTLSDAVKERLPDFHPKNYGFAQLGFLMKTLGERGLVRSEKTEFGWRVMLTTASEPSAAAVETTDRVPEPAEATEAATRTESEADAVPDVPVAPEVPNLPIEATETVAMSEEPVATLAQEPEPESTEPVSADRQPIIETIRAILREHGPVLSATVIGRRLKEQLPTFRPEDYGATTATALLRELRDRGILAHGGTALSFGLLDEPEPLPEPEPEVVLLPDQDAVDAATAAVLPIVQARYDQGKPIVPGQLGLYLRGFKPTEHGFENYPAMLRRLVDVGRLALIEREGKTLIVPKEIIA